MLKSDKFGPRCLHCVVVVFIILFSGYLANAQLYVGARAGIGLPAIINQNNYGQSELDYNISVKPIGSILLGYNLSDDNEIQLRMAYRGTGQSYTGTAQSTMYDRTIRSSSLNIAVAYRFDLASPENVVQKIYFLIGPRLGLLLTAEQEFKINGSETDFLTYVLDRKNPNESKIVALGEPADHKDFFTSYDLGMFGGVGFENSINDQLYWNIEMIGSIGITDINSLNWKLPNREESLYESSYNIIGGLNVGITYYFDYRPVPRIF